MKRRTKVARKEKRCAHCSSNTPVCSGCRSGSFQLSGIQVIKAFKVLFVFQLLFKVTNHLFFQSINTKTFHNDRDSCP